MALQYLDSILGTFVAHPYITIFIGLFFFGETVLLPAIYFTLDGRLHLPYIIAIAMFVTIASDIFWYYVGAHMKERFAKKIVTSRLQKTVEKLSLIFARQSNSILYFSKFVYGTRTAVQILSGLQPMPFRKYITINFLGVFSLLMFIITLAYSVNLTVENIHGIVRDLQVSFLIFIIILISTHIAISTYFKKIWSQ